jgi:hypothetical protein
MALIGSSCGRLAHADAPGTGCGRGHSGAGGCGLTPPKGPTGSDAVTEPRSLSEIVGKGEHGASGEQGSAFAVPAPANSRAGATAAAAVTPNAAMSRFVLVLWVVFMTAFLSRASARTAALYVRAATPGKRDIFCEICVPQFWTGSRHQRGSVNGALHE